MKAIRVAALTTVLMLTLCATAWAQAVRFEITPVIGGQVFAVDLPASFALERQDGRPAEFRDMELKPAATFGGSAGVRLLGSWGLEANARYTPTRFTPVSGSGPEQDVGMLTLGGSMSALLPSRITGLSPYVVGGAGARLLDFDDADLKSVREFTWNFGVGAVAELTPALGIVVEARNHVSKFRSGLHGVRNKLQNDLVAVAGLRLTLGQDRAPLAAR